MAQSSKIHRERKRELALSLDLSRTSLSAEAADLRRRLNPAQAARIFVRKHPLKTFGITAGAVALLVILFRPGSRKCSQCPRKPRKSLIARLFGWSFGLALPTFRTWAFKQAKEFIQAKHAGPETDSLLGP